MALTCPIGLDVAGLRAEIQMMYSRVATSPNGEFHFHRGPNVCGDEAWLRRDGTGRVAGWT